jgi:hypothetical protein
MTPLGSPPDVVAGEAHVNVVAEDSTAEHLAELVLGLHFPVHGSLADPPRGAKEIRFGTRTTLRVVHEHTQDVLGCPGAALCWYKEVPHHHNLRHHMFTAVLSISEVLSYTACCQPERSIFITSGTGLEDSAPKFFIAVTVPPTHHSETCRSGCFGISTQISGSESSNVTRKLFSKPRIV